LKKPTRKDLPSSNKKRMEASYLLTEEGGHKRLPVKTGLKKCELEGSCRINSRSAESSLSKWEKPYDRDFNWDGLDPLKKNRTSWMKVERKRLPRREKLRRQTFGGRGWGKGKGPFTRVKGFFLKSEGRNRRVTGARGSIRKRGKEGKTSKRGRDRREHP